MPRKPISGGARRCARAATGQAVAPLSRVMNSRRRIWKFPAVKKAGKVARLSVGLPTHGPEAIASFKSQPRKTPISRVVADHPGLRRMRSAALSVYLARATATVPEGPIDELAPLAEKLLE